MFMFVTFFFNRACPQGHDILMATMLNGAAIMDGALLLIAANESCPQPQTSEHLAAVEIMRLQHIIILQNKVDLVQENVAINQHEAIRKFIQVHRAFDVVQVIEIIHMSVFNTIFQIVSTGYCCRWCPSCTDFCAAEVQY